jgi:predicted CoA-binding protein
MNDVITEFLNNKRIAVVGSFRHPDKVAYLILKELKALGYEVCPVTPNKAEVEGMKCYPSVADLPAGMNAINVVTPPAVSIKIAEAALEKGIGFVWLQPGAEDDNTIDFCKKHGIKVIYKSCILTVLAEKQP